MSNFVTFFLLESTEDQLKFALLPWSYFPPHKGHYDFIKYYSDLVGDNGKVVIFIDPKKYAKISKEILSQYVNNLPNVIVSIASQNPIISTKKFGNEALKYSDEPIIILGCQKDQESIAQMGKVKEYYEANIPDCYVIDPQTTACDNIEEVSNDLFMKAMGDIKEVVQFLPDHLDKNTKLKIAKTISRLSNS